MIIVPIPLYSPKLVFNLVASIVPSAGTPILTELPNAIMKMFASAVGAFEKVISSLLMVYALPSSCITPPNDTNSAFPDLGYMIVHQQLN